MVDILLQTASKVLVLTGRTSQCGISFHVKIASSTP
jgi:hypothetical protein